ncbi:MAG TPA: glycosyltransferase family 4 protein [Myxococcales bacterium]|nr:glycosyltransferase family 4 protein [Myxococcales bacterium]
MPGAPHNRILLVGDFPPPQGGLATHVEELLRAVRSRGSCCEVLDIGKGQLPADCVLPAGGVARFSAQLASYAARGFRVHLHTSGANPKSWVLMQVCALTRAPIVTLHSGLMPAFLRASPARRAVARAVLRRYAAVIAVSEPIREALRECGVRGVQVMPAFLGAALQPGAPPAGFAELRAEAAPLYCAMVAPRPEYGASVLLRALATLLHQRSHARLALYGAGSEALRVAGARGFGELPRPQALALMAGCDVFVRPTLADGDSVSIREALALGRPVVATSVGNRPPEARLVPPGDAEALAAAMLAAAEAAPASRAGAAPGVLDRILSLYQEEACAASAAS